MHVYLFIKNMTFFTCFPDFQYEELGIIYKFKLGYHFSENDNSHMHANAALRKNKHANT